MTAGRLLTLLVSLTLALAACSNNNNNGASFELAISCNCPTTFVAYAANLHVITVSGIPTTANGKDITLTSTPQAGTAGNGLTKILTGDGTFSFPYSDIFPPPPNPSPADPLKIANYSYVITYTNEKGTFTSKNSPIDVTLNFQTGNPLVIKFSNNAPDKILAVSP